MRFALLSKFSVAFGLAACAAFSSESTVNSPDQQSLTIGAISAASEMATIAASAGTGEPVLSDSGKQNRKSVRETLKQSRHDAGHDGSDLLLVLNAPDESTVDQTSYRNAMYALISAGQKDGGAKIIEQCESLRANAAPMAKTRMIDVLAALDTQATRNFVVSFLNDSERTVQRRAVNAINLVDQPQAQKAVIDFLASADVLLKKEAIIAVGRGRCVAALSRLSELLDTKDAAVKTDVQWSLRRITGRGFESTLSAKLWYDSERKDGEERFQTFNDQFKNRDTKLAPLAVAELGNLMLMREKVEGVLVTLLRHPDFRVRAAVCDALSDFTPSTQTLVLLTGMLNDSSDVVAATAWRGLKDLTQQELPRDFKSWDQWLRKHGYH